MSSTKEMIIEKARELFAKKDFSKISVKEIADFCGISPGNLTYHFKKKEELIIAANQDAYSEVFKSLSTNTGENIHSLIGVFKTNETHQIEHIFYSKNKLELAKSSKFIHKRQLRFREQGYYYYLRTFFNLRKEGLFRGDIEDEHYYNLAFDLMQKQYMWYETFSPVSDLKISKLKPFCSNFTLFKSLCYAIYPYLTGKGLEEWNQCLTDGTLSFE